MCPVITFSLFGAIVSVGAYWFFIAIAAVTGILMAALALRKILRPFECALLLSALTASFFIGSRLLNFLVNTASYGEDLRILSFRLKGFSLYGGILAALLVFFILIPILKLKPWPILDAIVLPFTAAFCLVRVGCFLNGCCGGKITRSFVGVHFPERETFFTNALSSLGLGTAVYPTQIFEIGLAILGLIPAFLTRKAKKYPPGTAFTLYGIWFCGMRWVVLYFRALPYPSVVAEIIYPVLYGLLIFFGSVLMILRCRKIRARPPS